MKLQEHLPTGVNVGGRFYRLDFDFRNVLELMDVLARDDIMPGARDYIAVKCLMKRPPKCYQAVLSAAKEILFPATKKAADKGKITDFVQDADLIRAAFLQVYGINLYRDKLHWLEFQGLLAGLPEGSRYSDVLGIRARPMPKATKYNAEERNWLLKAKAACALQMSEEEAEENLDRCIRNVFVGLMDWAKRGGDNG